MRYHIPATISVCKSNTFRTAPYLKPKTQKNWCARSRHVLLAFGLLLLSLRTFKTGVNKATGVFRNEIVYFYSCKEIRLCLCLHVCVCLSACLCVCLSTRVWVCLSAHLNYWLKHQAVVKYSAFTFRHNHRWLKVKVKYLGGAFKKTRSFRWPHVPCSWSKVFGTMPLSSAFSPPHIPSGAWLLPTPRLICLRGAQLKLHTYIAGIVALKTYNLTGATYFHNGFRSQVVMTGDWTCNPQMREPAHWPSSQSSWLSPRASQLRLYIHSHGYIALRAARRN